MPSAPIIRVLVTIEGLLPGMLQNKYDTDAARASAGTSKTLKGDSGLPREQAARKAYVAQDGTLYIPSDNLLSCLVGAGIFHKVGRRQLTTRDSTLVTAGINIPAETLSLGTKQWEVDARRVVNPTTKGAQICYRPLIFPWAITFEMEINTGVLAPALIRKLVDDAGTYTGLGDYRPSCKGKFGKFIVKCWEEIDRLPRDETKKKKKPTAA